MIEEQSKQIASVSINEVILSQLHDLKEGQREINRRMDRIENRMDRLEKKVDDKLDRLESKIDENRKELNTRIDKLESKMDSSTNQGQIATISTIGIGVAAVSSTVALLYSLFAK